MQASPDQSVNLSLSSHTTGNARDPPPPRAAHTDSGRRARWPLMLFGQAAVYMRPGIHPFYSSPALGPGRSSKWRMRHLPKMHHTHLHRSEGIKHTVLKQKKTLLGLNTGTLGPRKPRWTATPRGCLPSGWDACRQRACDDLQQTDLFVRFCSSRRILLP